MTQMVGQNPSEAACLEKSSTAEVSPGELVLHVG